MDQAGLEEDTAFRGHPSASSSPTAQGNISVQADHVVLRDGSAITASTSGDGKAGDIAFAVQTLRSNMGEDGVPLSAAAPVTIASNSTGQGRAGRITISRPEGLAADLVWLSNTEIVASVTAATIPTTAPMSKGEHVEGFAPEFIPTFPPPTIEITAEHVTLGNGTVMKADTTGSADAGSITFNVGTMTTQAGPDWRLLISSTSN